MVTETKFTGLQQEVYTLYSIIMVNALTLNMQGKAYNKEPDAENWTVSMDLYRLSSVLMPELQWLSW